MGKKKKNKYLVAMDKIQIKDWLLRELLIKNKHTASIEQIIGLKAKLQNQSDELNSMIHSLYYEHKEQIEYKEQIELKELF